MKAEHARHPALERDLAQLLQYGTCLGSLAIAMGLVLTWLCPIETSLASLGSRVVVLGIALFIILPIVRVALMLGVFLRDRDYRFAAIAMIVLMVIASGAVLGTYLGSQVS